jgi:hypothetical protein
MKIKKEKKTKKREMKKVMASGIVIMGIMTILGCGAASSGTNSSTVSQAEKKAVMEAIGNAYKVSKEEKTVVASQSIAMSMSVNDASSSEETTDIWICTFSGSSTEEKETFSLGLQTYDKSIWNCTNNALKESFILTEWRYEIDNENSDVYSIAKEKLYDTSFHSLIYLPATNAYNEGHGKTVVSRFTGTVSYKSGIKLEIKNGEVSSICQSGDCTISMKYPFTFKYDANNDGLQETYSGAFKVTDMASNDTSAYISSTIANEEGVIYGEVRVKNDGSVEVVPTE